MSDTNRQNSTKHEFLACRAEGDARARLEQAARRQGRSMSGVLRWLIDSLPAVQGDGAGQVDRPQAQLQN